MVVMVIGGLFAGLGLGMLVQNFAVILARPEQVTPATGVYGLLLGGGIAAMFLASWSRRG